MQQGRNGFGVEGSKNIKARAVLIELCWFSRSPIGHLHLVARLVDTNSAPRKGAYCTSLGTLLLRTTFEVPLSLARG